MLIYVLVFVPCLLGSGEGSFLPEHSQKGVRLAATSGPRFLDATSSRNARDRRMAHWESRTHLTFDDKDGDDAGQISYPSILEEPPSSLGFLPSIAHRLRSTGSNLELTKGILRKENTWKPEENCTIDVSPVHFDAPILEFTRERHRLRLASDMTPRIKRIVVRCPRRTIQNQMIQEPISVEEPGWILIDVTHDELQDDYDQDPFYVARGKRPSPVDQETRQDEEAKSSMLLDEDVDGTVARKKRDALVESLRRYLLEGEQTSLVSSRSTEQDDVGEPVLPRNKHSDLFDILNEPFVISRGKKDSSGKNAFRPPNNGYSRARLNFQATSRVLDTLIPQAT